MARNLSLTAMQSALAQVTSEVWLTFCKVEHATLGTPLYLVNNSENVLADSVTYTAYPFTVQLPDDTDNKEPTARLVIDNVDRAYVDEIRNMQTTPTITLSVRLASSPNTVEYGPIEFETLAVTYDANTITFNLGFGSFIAEPFPYRTFNPREFPGMFK